MHWILLMVFLIQACFSEQTPYNHNGLLVLCYMLCFKILYRVLIKISIKNAELWGGTPPKEFIYKNCVFILTCLNFSHLQGTLHSMQYTYQDIFPIAPNSFWTRQFWYLSVLLLCFVSTLPHWQNMSLSGLFFIWENKSLSGMRLGE